MRRSLLASLLTLAVGSLWPGAGALASPSALGDFNGDGRADVAVGVPTENVGQISNAGAVNVLYGSSSGLSATGNQLWHQNSVGVLDAAEEGDNFGFSVTAGDFNADGRADLAVGVPFEDAGPQDFETPDAGAVNVLYGSASGLSATGNQFWHQSSASIADAVEADDEFGFALTADDFNGNGRDDLAVGVPFEDVGPQGSQVSDAGAVNVLYGSASRLSATGNQLWHQNSANVLENAQTNDQFGFSLAAGDLNGNGRADLAVGVPFEDVGPAFSRDIAGAVNVLYGSASGLSATGNQFWHQDSGGVIDDGQGNDRFGVSLSAGDFNGNGRADLAVGVPFEDVPADPSGSLQVIAGAVSVLYGTPSGLSATGNQLWHQNSMGVLDSPEPGDRLGFSLAAGDFNGNGRSDLAVGVPFENVGPPDFETPDAGAVNVLYGGASGLAATGNQFWHQNSAGVLDVVEPVDNFGSALAAGDFNGNARADLAVGVVVEDIGTVADAGAVNVLYGTPSRLAATGNQFWHQNSAGILDAVEASDLFGFALAAGERASPA